MILPAAQRHYRWNFTFWVVETASWMFGTAFIDTTTILPVLVQLLSDSPVLVGLIVSIRYAGQGWPQLFAASMVSGTPRKKFFYLRVVAPGRLLLLWPALLLLAGITRPTLILPAVLLAYLAFWVSEGFSIVPWVDMLGKTVPPRRRGRLFAVMYAVGGGLGILAGGITRAVLRDRPFPNSYGNLFLFSLGGAILSTVAIGLLREPPSPANEEQYSTWALIKDIPNLLRAMPQFRLLVQLQALFGFAILPSPFYVIYATELLHRAAPAARSGASVGVGVFLAVQTAATIFGNTLWGYLSDRYGNRLLLRVLAIVHILVPLSAILAGYIAFAGASFWTIMLGFSVTFFGYGALIGSTWMAVTNFLLELAPKHDRPAYIAVTNALNIPAFVLPLLGGLLLHALGYLTIFAIAAVFLLFAAILTRWLEEPREMLAHLPHPPPEPWE